ncbi:hypothetical protein AB9K34_17520 [Sedimentitalea sp. XS_ASV28]
MLESTTSPEMRLIFLKAHEDRARLFFALWRRLLPRRHQRTV